MAEQTTKIKKVKLQYDRCNAREVYAVMKTFFDTSAKDWTPEMIFPFIPEGADATRWQKTLRNVEYNATKAKPKRTKRTRCNLKSRSAGDVAKSLTTDALLKKE